MLQIIQNLKSGDTILEEVPAPQVRKGALLIRTTHTLVSLGTERMLVEFGKANLLDKARQQPDKVKQVLDKIRTEGLMPTLEAVFNKLGQPLPLGYCNAGVVEAIGDGVSGYSIGDRVVSNGPHAEYVCIPQNLCAKIPDGVSNEEASFTVIASIGLQGIRLINPTLGETIVVVGLGLIGLLTAQLLKANGCRVIGTDIDPKKLALANSWGITAINAAEGDVVKAVESATNGIGADGVVITASAKTDEIISQAARMSRKRGRIVLVGVIGLNLSRAEFFEKELTFQVSCSYGPGRYDENYEQRGQDYPLPFVRWTEQRNFDAILQAMQTGTLKVKELITQKVNLENYNQVYGNISGGGAIASILEYPQRAESQKATVELKNNSFAGSKGVLGVIGAGNFTAMTMMPALKDTGAGFKYVASAGGLTGTSLAKKYGFSHSTTDYKELLKDSEVDLICITTRHNSHASMATEALEAGKNVFVEKPLALSKEELDRVVSAHQKSGKSLTVGFNRRFSPHARKLKQMLGSGPMHIVATMNAGAIPPNVWVHDLKTGGGRIVGEACHFIDLCTYFTGSKVKSVYMHAMGNNPATNTDNATLVLHYADGSNAVINYFANGSKAYPKERIEVYSLERTAVIDNFRVLEGYGFRGFSKLKTSLDKGHKTQFKELIDTVKKGGLSLIPIDELVNTTLASFAALESLQTGGVVMVEG